MISYTMRIEWTNEDETEWDDLSEVQYFPGGVYYRIIGEHDENHFIPYSEIHRVHIKRNPDDYF